jgi:hypothetical protein
VDDKMRNKIWLILIILTGIINVSSQVSYNDCSIYGTCKPTEIIIKNYTICEGGDDTSWNKTYADSLYTGIIWNYNQTTATFNLYNSTWDNSFMNKWNYNQTYSGSTYNSTYAGLKNYYPTLINLTTGTYNGSLINGTKIGYSAGNSICNASFSGSHLCDEFEVTQWFANANPNINDDAWIIAGAPKYIPATVPVNDCNAFTYAGTVLYLGNYWHFNSTTGGDGRAINCATLLHLACCNY